MIPKSCDPDFSKDWVLEESLHFVVQFSAVWRGGRVVDGGGLENRRAKAPWVRILPPPPNRILFADECVYASGMLLRFFFDSMELNGRAFSSVPDCPSSEHFSLIYPPGKNSNYLKKVLF